MARRTSRNFLQPPADLSETLFVFPKMKIKISRTTEGFFWEHVACMCSLQILGKGIPNGQRRRRLPKRFFSYLFKPSVMFIKTSLSSSGWGSPIAGAPTLFLDQAGPLRSVTVSLAHFLVAIAQKGYLKGVWRSRVEVSGPDRCLGSLPEQDIRLSVIGWPFLWDFSKSHQFQHPKSLKSVHWVLYLHICTGTKSQAICISVHMHVKNVESRWKAQKSPCGALLLSLCVWNQIHHIDLTYNLKVVLFWVISANPSTKSSKCTHNFLSLEICSFCSRREKTYERDGNFLWSFVGLKPNLAPILLTENSLCLKLVPQIIDC